MQRHPAPSPSGSRTFANSPTAKQFLRKLAGKLRMATVSAIQGYVPARLRGQPPRRFHALGLGTPKSGTMSLAKIFELNFRAKHEAEFLNVLQLLAGVHSGSGSRQAQRAELKRRDNRLHLEMEASSLLSEFSDLFPSLFPEAKYVLTVRDCYSWLDSTLNSAMNERNADGSPNTRWSRILFQPEAFGYSRYDEPLRIRGLFPLDAYLKFWARTNSHILSNIPSSKLLVVRTFELKEQIGSIANFLGVPALLLDDKASHKNSTEHKHGICAELDPRYLKDQFDAHCSELMSQFYPDMGFHRDRFSNRSPAWKIQLNQLARDIEQGRR
jgi:hypothetical protein